MRNNTLAIASFAVSLALLASCRQVAHKPDTKTAAYTFETSVFLDDRAEITANASIGDLDGDRDLDIVLAKGRHWPVRDLVLLNDGKAGFDERHALGTAVDRSYTAALADLDGDGDLDLAVGNDRPDAKLVYFNDGHGHFEPAGTFGKPDWSTRNLTLADLNGDKRADIIVANRGGANNASRNYVCLNDGAGRFPACVVLSSDSASTIAAADIDGDGSVDLIVPHRDRGQSAVFLNNGAGAFAQKRPFGNPDAATRAVAAADVTGDGLPDLIVGDEARGGAYLYTNQGHGSFSAPLAVGDDKDTVFAIAAADLNRDGKVDLVFGNDRAPMLVLLNTGDGRRFTSARFGDGDGAVYGLAIADITADGCPDIVSARSEARSVLFINTCGK